MTTLVSHSTASPTTAANNSSFEAVLSRDGRFVAFTSSATNLIPGQTGTGTNVFLFDRTTGNNLLVSHSPGNPTEGGGNCESPWISETGRYLAFLNNGFLYLFDREADTLTPVHPGTLITDLALSADGRYLAFLSTATGLVPGQSDANGGADAFLYDQATGTTVLASRSASSPSTTGNSAAADVADVSSDGRFVTFFSSATDHVSGQMDTNSGQDLFLFDRTAGMVSLVSHAASSLTTSANLGASDGGSLSR